MFAVQGDVIVSTKDIFITAQGNRVLPRLVHSNTIVGEALRRMEIEDEQQPSTLVHYDLVDLMFQRYVCLQYSVSNAPP